MLDSDGATDKMLIEFHISKYSAGTYICLFGSVNSINFVKNESIFYDEKRVKKSNESLITNNFYESYK